MRRVFRHRDGGMSRFDLVAAATAAAAAAAAASAAARPIRIFVGRLARARFGNVVLVAA